MPRSSAIRESAACIIATSGVKPPEGPASRPTFAVPAKGFVCRNEVVAPISDPRTPPTPHPSSSSAAWDRRHPALNPRKSSSREPDWILARHRPEGLSGESAFAVPSTGLVCRNHARRDYSGPVRSPDARFPSFFNLVEPSGSRRQHSKVAAERAGLNIGEAQARTPSSCPINS